MSAPWNTPHLTNSDKNEPSVDPDTITVYNMRFCPFAERTILVLLAKKIPFRVININLKKKPEWFVEKTWGTVSVVRHKGAYVMESLVNSDYIDELYPETCLHSKDPLEKAKGRLLVELFGKMRAPYYGILMAKKDTPEETEAERNRLFVEVKKTLVAMDSELSKTNHKFFSGSKAGMTDLMVWPWLERLEGMLTLVPCAERKIPGDLTHLLTWIAAMREEDCVKQYGLSPSQHADFYKSTATGEPSYDMLLTKGA